MNTVPEPEPLAEDHRAELLRLARRSIAHRLEENRAFLPRPGDYHPALRRQRASFVTLHLAGSLRGCIGSLQAERTLVEDVARNAQAAAFEDPRFSPLVAEEFEHLEYHISVLSPPRPLAVASREELLEHLRPRIDGLVIEEGHRRATFLPSVWEQLPEPEQFVSHLRLKAGLSAAGWNSGTRILTYQVEEIS